MAGFHFWTRMNDASVQGGRWQICLADLHPSVMPLWAFQCVLNNGQCVSDESAAVKKSADASEAVSVGAPRRHAPLRRCGRGHRSRCHHHDKEALCGSYGMSLMSLNSFM